MSESNIYEAIFETTNVGMAIAEISGRFIKVNKSLCDFLGYTKEELQGKTFQEISYETDLKEDLRHIDEINRGIIDTFDMEKRYFTKDGSLVWADLTVTAARKADKKVDYYIAVIKDINELKKAREELRIQKEEFETIFNASKEGIAILDLEANFLNFNDAYLKLTGFEREELLSKSCVELSIPEDVIRAKQAIQEAIEKGYIENFEKSCIVKNNKKITVNMSLVLLPDKKRVLITAKDMSEKKAYEELLKKTIEQQEALLKIETAGFVHIKDGKFTWTNRAFEKILGYEAGELNGKDTSIIYKNKEEYEIFGRESSIALKTSKTYNKEINCLSKRGEELVLMKSLTAIEGSLGEALGVFIDITQMKENELSIQKAETKFFTLFNEALDPIAVIDPLEHKILEVNPAANKLYGYSSQEFRQLPISAIEVLEDQAEINKRQEAMIKKGWDRFITKHRTKEGLVLDVIVSVRAIQLENKPYLYATFHDITAEKESERQLIEVKTELEKQKEFITNLLDAQPNMMLLTDGNSSSFMNKAALRYFKCKSLSEFTERYNCICNQFIRNDIYFHSQKVRDGQNWIEALLNLPQDEHIVTIQSIKDGVIRAFNVSVRKFNNDYVVNFTDISETVLKQRDLEDKTIHDKLTKVYNREYLEQNIQRVLSQNETIAFAMIDIDHFKKINDTYGHDVGDEVLKELVKVISDFSRKEDVLIRWGGEEFLLLLKADDKETLAKVLEHIREAVQNHIFNIVDKLTCSFGAVLHNPSHTWKKSFKAADIALYKAKASGRNLVIIM